MKIISQILVVAIINLVCTYSYAWVDSAATNIMVHKKAIAKVYRQQLLDLADRQEVIDQLAQYGVSREEAIRRINSLTDEEIAFFYENIDHLPSGGEEGPVTQFFYIIFLSPAILIMGISWVIFKVLSPVLCLFKFDDYQNCLNSDQKYFSSPNKIVGPSQGASCMEPCYSDFNDCMESSDNSAEENLCAEAKTTCVQQCEGDFN